MERAVYQLAKHLGKRGVSTLLFTRPAETDSTPEDAFPGEVQTVPYRALPVGRHGGVLDRTLNYPRFALRLGQAVAERVRAATLDVVHAQGLTALGYGRLRRSHADLEAPLVMNPQGMEEHKTSGVKRLALSRLRALSKEAARLSDRVIATDEATRDEVPRLLGVPEPKVEVLPNGIDLDEIRNLTPADAGAQVRAAFPALAGVSLLLLCVGRLEAYKGFGDVLDALELLRARDGLPPRWALVVVGEGPHRHALQQGQARLGASHLLLAGRVSERLLHALYATANVFVHAPHFEGSSLVTLEAMAHGLPVVATRVGGIPDKVQDGETGRLVAAGDPAGLARAVEPLAADSSLRSRLGQAGRRHVLDHFAWDAIADRTIALYERLLAEARRP
jgi:glycosyltransferase involved in cell wall biosynthesis